MALANFPTRIRMIGWAERTSISNARKSSPNKCTRIISIFKERFFKKRKSGQISVSLNFGNIMFLGQITRVFAHGGKIRRDVSSYFFLKKSIRPSALESRVWENVAWHVQYLQYSLEVLPGDHVAALPQLAEVADADVALEAHQDGAVHRAHQGNLF